MIEKTSDAIDLIQSNFLDYKNPQSPQNPREYPSHQPIQKQICQQAFDTWLFLNGDSDSNYSLLNKPSSFNNHRQTNQNNPNKSNLHALNIVNLLLGEHHYQIPRAYLNQNTIEQVQHQSKLNDLPFMLCLDSFDPPQDQLFKEHILKVEVEISYANPLDPDCLHFMNIWDTFFHQKSDRKPQYFYQSLYGYQWGRLNDLIEWFGLISLPTDAQKNNLEQDSIAVYGKTTDQILRIFICWISQNLVIDFNVPNYKLPNMLDLAYKMASLVHSWKIA